MVDWVGGAFSLFLSLPVVASHAWSLSHLYVSLPSDTGERKPHTLSHSLPYSVFIQSFHEYFLSAKSMPNSVLGNEYAEIINHIATHGESELLLGRKTYR